jgi:hypothetical protein
MTTAEYEAVANHEAAHAAAAALLGVLPTRVQVGGLSAPSLGRVAFEHVDVDRPVARKHAQVLLAGWCGNNEDPPSWPPSEQAPKGSDERKLATLATYLDLDRGSYGDLVHETWRLAASPEFRLAEVGFRTALTHRHVLDAGMISRVLHAAMAPERLTALYGRKENRMTQRKSIPAGFRPSSDGLVAIVGRDGQPVLVLADSVPWWERDEEMAYGIDKAFDAGGLRRNGNSDHPIQIKSFTV